MFRHLALLCLGTGLTMCTSAGDGAGDDVGDSVHLIDLAFEIRSDTLMDLQSDVLAMPPDEIAPETSVEDPPETGGGCHYDCFGGFSCSGGQMSAYHHAPYPCSGFSSCTKSSWPCVSGECGPIELCLDDIEYLDSLVSDEAEWAGGELEGKSGYTAESCYDTTCVWLLRDAGGSEIFRLRTEGLSPEDPPVEGTTNLSVVDLVSMEGMELSINGVPTVLTSASFTWASLREHASDVEPYPHMGVSGAVTVEEANGKQTTFVWIREYFDGSPVRIAIEIDDTNMECLPPKPHVLDGACVECLSSGDCDDELACNPQNHRCEPEECGDCVYPNTTCMTIDGIWSCVQCKYDEDCTQGASCDEDLHACVGAKNGYCATCETDETCVTLAGSSQLACDVESGCCYDVDGWCDGLLAYCPDGSCQGLWSALGCGADPPPGEPLCLDLDPWLDVCTCSEPLDPDALPGCIADGYCADEHCPGETLCVGSAFLEAIGSSYQIESGICIPKGLVITER